MLWFNPPLKDVVLLNNYKHPQRSTTEVVDSNFLWFRGLTQHKMFIYTTMVELVLLIAGFSVPKYFHCFTLACSSRLQETGKKLLLSSLEVSTRQEVTSKMWKLAHYPIIEVLRHQASEAGACSTPCCCAYTHTLYMRVSYMEI